MFVLGTAGHIDHGKSSIIRRLTGIDPDRLPEEKERGLTIDLGFAWMQLPSGQRVGFVDVPGHEKFVKNMIAGVGSIDAALLVVAADDGWMPQTEEHIQILDLLGIKTGLVILNKIDLVEPDWVELVSADLSERLGNRGVNFKNIVPVSAAQNLGFDRLIASIDSLLKDMVAKPDISKPRLYADRAFTIVGMGTVLTGTLIGGKFKVGDEVSLYPVNERARIRNLQTHKEQIDTAVQGSRVAVNVTGSEKRNLHRGIMISGLTDLLIANSINCRIEIPSTGKMALKHNSRIVFLLGTAEILGKVLLIDSETIKPGFGGFCKIHLQEEVCPFLGDRFIIRSPSPATTIGGGVILDFKVPGKIRPNSRDHLYLKSLYPLSPANIVSSLIIYKGFWDNRDFNYVRNSIFPNELFAGELARLCSTGDAIKSRGIYFSMAMIDESTVRIEGVLKSHHSKSPWSPGLGGKELMDLVEISSEEIGSALLDFMVSSGWIQTLKGNYFLSEHSSNLPPDLERLAAEIIRQYLEFPFESLTRSELEKKGKDYQIVIKYLISCGKLIEGSGGILFHKRIFDESKAQITEFLLKNKKAKSSELRQLLDTTRKYAIPLLERLDRDGITSFDGEYRTLTTND